MKYPQLKRLCASILAGITILMACEREVDLRPEGNGHIAVECVLSEAESQTLRLSMTDMASASLRDAVIALTDESQGALVGQFLYGEDDIWTLNYSAIPGHKYLLTVDVEGYDRLTAHTLMPCEPSINHTVMTSSDYIATGFEGLPDCELGSRYEIKSLPDGAVWIYGIYYNAYTLDYEYAPAIATSLNNADLFNLTGKTFKNPENEWVDETSDPDYPKQYRSKYYQYVDGCPLHDKFLRIPPLTENADRTAADPNGYFSVAGFYQVDSVDNVAPFSYVIAVAVSDEYDHYLKDLLMEESRQEQMQGFAGLFYHDNISGNIEGGIGIFGAKTEQELPWTVIPTYTYTR